MTANSRDRDLLLLPMRIDALTVGKPQRPGKVFTWGSIAPEFDFLRDGWQRGDELRPDLADPSSPGTPLPPGIHLHFRLPAALCHGESSRAGSNSGGTADGDPRTNLDFPHVPNRWLIQRYDEHWKAKMWMLRSDEESPDAPVVLPVWPATVASGSEYRQPLQLIRTGACSPIQPGDDPDFDRESGVNGLKLTAATAGNAAFSRHYPSCRGILGFHDDLYGQPDGIFSYLVTGWYSPQGGDPWKALLEKARAAGERRMEESGSSSKEKLPSGADMVGKWMEERRLTYPFPDDFEVGQLPQGLLCYGWIRGVAWKRDAALHDEKTEEAFKSPNLYWLGIGNTVGEALASWLAPDGDNGGLIEDAVEGFQAGLLDRGTPLADIDAELHRLGFTPVGSGTVFSIVPAGTASAEAGPSAPIAVPQQFQDGLEKVNERQREVDLLRLRAAALLWQIYALWHRGIQAERNHDPKLEERLSGIRGALQTILRKSLQAAASAAQAACDRAKTELETSILDSGQGWEIKALGAPPFQVPNDPVMVIGGPAMRTMNTSMDAGPLPCRRTGDEFARLKIGDKWFQPDLGRFEPRHLADLGRFAPWAASLLSEMCLLDQYFAVWSGSGFAIQLPDDKSVAGIENGLGISLSLPQGLAPFGKPGSQTARREAIESFLPMVGTFYWQSNPWIPQYLLWQAAWRSGYEGSLTGKRDLITSHWSLDSTESGYRRKSDLVPEAPQDQTAGDGRTITGYAYLSAPRVRSGVPETSALEQIAQTLNRLLAAGSKSHGGSNPAGAPSSGSTLAQVATGFHDALTTRHLGDQLPPLQYFTAGSPIYLDPVEASLSAIRLDCSPEFRMGSKASPYPFYPVRNGRLQVEKIWIVDAFGQKVSIPDEVAARASRRLAAGTGASGRIFTLRPRFSQPMRLDFSSQPAETPSANAPRPGSVCGWLIWNRLEQSMAVYAANGALFGALQKRFGDAFNRSSFYWTPAPGINETASGTPPRIGPSLIPNDHLRDFVNFVLRLRGDSGEALSRLIAKGLAGAEQRIPEGEQTLSLLVGRPLALVRAGLQFQTPGIPALNPNTSWTRADADELKLSEVVSQVLKGCAPGAGDALLDTGGFEDVDWPVRLGDYDSPSDGLIGFFAGDPPTGESSGTGRPFYAAWGMGLAVKEGDDLKSVQNLRVNCRAPLKLTLLMDPAARVHATTGVLPRVAFALSAGEATGVRKARDAFFQTAPVLGAEAMPRIPKPSDDYGEWSWACHPPVTGKLEWSIATGPAPASESVSDAVPWPTISEGWLKLKMEPVRILGFWQKSPPHSPIELAEGGANVVLAWKTRGARSIELSRVSGDAKTDTSVFSEASGEKTVTVNEDAEYELAATDGEDSRFMRLKIQVRKKG